MNWSCIRKIPWVDTRACFVAGTPQCGTLLDLGSSDGETLCHIAELRPDLKLFAVDLLGNPEAYPKGTEFFRGNLETASLPWPDGSMDAITCMHLVEHLRDLKNIFHEASRLLRPGGRLYIETPHKKTLNLPSPKGKAAGTFTVNFYDDPTHIKVVEVETLKSAASQSGLTVLSTGTSRNLFFAAVYAAYAFLPASRKKFTSYVHWVGWSAYITARKNR